MGILANTVSFCQFTVAGDLPPHDLYPWVAERLARYGFHSIDEGAAERSVGWVHLDDHKDTSFAVPAHFWRDRYVVFTLRRDQRKVPAPLLKAYRQEAEGDFLARNPGLSRVPKQKREELTEAVRGMLLARTLPVPATWDAVWDTTNGTVTFSSLSPSVVELFETEFKKSFDGLRLILIHPFARAGRLLSGAEAEGLEIANRATSEAALDLIRANRWLGKEFLLWLLYLTMTGSGEHRVTVPGIAVPGEPFVAYLNDRLLLVQEGETVQRVTVAGPQDNFSEVCTALRNGKEIVDATLYLEKGDDQWRLTLKGELFQFASMRGPTVQLERGATVDEEDERQSHFFERMYILEQGLQLFDSLYQTFLKLRLGDGWQGTRTAMDRWLQEGAPESP
jgi:hypothetical protein